MVKAGTASDVSFMELPTLLTALKTATFDSYPPYSKLVCILVSRRFRCGIGRLSHSSFLVPYYTSLVSCSPRIKALAIGAILLPIMLLGTSGIGRAHV